MRVLVTGGAGFIGSHVVDELIELGHEVTSLDNLSPAAHAQGTKPEYLNSLAEHRFEDIRDGDAVFDALNGIDVVCHQAGMVGLGVDFDDIGDYVSNNDTGMAVLLNAMWRRRFSGRLVLGSSMVVYGEGRYTCVDHGDTQPGPRTQSMLEAGAFEPKCSSCGGALVWAHVSETAAPDPRNVYAATKLHQEHLAGAYTRSSGVPVTTLRYHNVYGPRMPRNTPYAGVASIFRSALENNTAPTVYEDGGQMRDFVHVRDVAHANVLAITSATALPGIFNIGSGRPTSILEMAASLSRNFSSGTLTPTVTGQFRLGDVRHIVASSQLAGAQLGYSAAVQFDDGMREFATAQLREGL